MAKPKFITAPEYNDTGVYEKLKQLGEYLRAVYAIEVDATNEQTAKAAVQNASHENGNHNVSKS